MTESARPAAVLSDMDGLLLDTERLGLDAFLEVAAAHGMAAESARELFMGLMGLNKAAQMEVFAAKLPQGVDADAFNAAWMGDFLGRMARDGVPVKRHAKEMLAWCAAHDIPVALVTSSSRDKADDMLTRAGLFDFFTASVTGDEIAHGKPAPDIFMEAARRLGVAPGDCIALEDSANGVRAAHAAGARVIQVVDLRPPDAALRALGHEVVASLAELSRHLGWGFAE